MAATLAQLSRLIADVRDGEVCRSPRARLLQKLELLRLEAVRLRACGAREAAEEHSVQRWFIIEQLLSAYAKCERVHACLACTLSPCLCASIRALPIGRHHRLLLLLHPKEFLRTTNSGKLLLLAHPRASFLVPGLPSHDARLASICARRGACVLYPTEHALPLAAFCERAAADAPLHLIIPDGTWQQARRMCRQLPPSLPRVRVSDVGASLFGRTLRWQSREREECGRVSTVEAYAQAALELGEASADVAPLLQSLRAFIDATAPFSSHGHAGPRTARQSECREKVHLRQNGVAHRAGRRADDLPPPLRGHASLPGASSARFRNRKRASAPRTC
mmetsp:Transcript_19927/g.42408  ORF Transcript_19927/g.42408 Transcript_19927/m.42408 type:complete len:335 (+) Transcript_19927:189-1193(+)